MNKKYKNLLLKQIALLREKVSKGGFLYHAHLFSISKSVVIVLNIYAEEIDTLQSSEDSVAGITKSGADISSFI